jgi:hypothetical protein
VIALACSKPPKDAPRWNLAAIGDQGRGTGHRRTRQRQHDRQTEVGDPLALVLVFAGKKAAAEESSRSGRDRGLARGTVPSCAGSSSLLRSTGGTPDAAPLASHWRVQARLCFSIRPSVQTRMAVGQVGVRKSSRTLKFVSCARFMGMRTLGRFESEEIAAKGCFDRGSKRPTPPRNRSGGSPSRPAARVDAR